jgi:hypothetical protein
MLAALTTGAIDAGLLLQPTGAQAVAKGIGKILSDDYNQNAQNAVLVINSRLPGPASGRGHELSRGVVGRRNLRPEQGKSKDGWHHTGGNWRPGHRVPPAEPLPVSGQERESATLKGRHSSKGTLVEGQQPPRPKPLREHDQ